MLKILPEIQKNQYSFEEGIRFERLIYNLSSVPNFYNNYEDLSKSINGITNFINSYEGNLYNELITRGIEGFDNLQILEEVIKIILISKSSKWKNLIIEIEKDKLSNYKNIDQKILESNFRDTKNYLVPYFWGSTGLYINQSKTNKNFYSWNDLWSADLKKSILISKEPLDVFAISLKSLGYSVNTTNEQEIKKAYEKLLLLIPNIKKSVITGVALTFAHCIGEFGIVIMVGGNIPKETRIASVAIYDQVQALNFEAANRYAFVLFILSFLILLLIYSINRKTNFTTFR
mgnify:CR=1 FL=1